MRIDCLARLFNASRAIVLLALCTFLIAPAPAAAQTFISPFVGFDFGGDSGCITATACENRHSNLGVSVGKLWGIGGGEVELGYARNFFGDIEDADNAMLTLMFNVIVGPKVGPVRPFVLGGIGVMKPRVEFDTGTLLDAGNEFGYNIGGGLMLMFGEHIGVRGDIRRFQSWNENDLISLPIGSEKLGFNRASAGVVFGW